MGLELLPYLEGDNKCYPIVKLTSPKQWTREQHTKWRTALHTQLGNNTLNRFVDKDFQVNDSNSIKPKEINDDPSVNTHTTMNSSSLTDEDLESICNATLATSPDLFHSNNKICFSWNDMDKLFKDKTTENKSVVKEQDCISYFEPPTCFDLQSDESKTVFKMDQFLSNLPYQDLNGNNTKQTDLETMTAQAKVYHKVIKGNFDNLFI